MMFVTKRDGTEEKMSFDKISNRLKKLMWELDSKNINLLKVSQKVIQGLYNKITTVELDELSSQICANLITDHLDYGTLASRIEISNLHKQTKKKFSLVIEDLYNYVNPETGEKGSLISKKLYRIVMSNKKKINSSIIYDRDYNYDYFGIKTLQKSYLLKINKEVVERPQHMLMRVAIGIHGKDLDKAIETYNFMSEKYFTHATPTLFNAGTPKPQLSSCFLLQMQEDSIDGIYETLKQTAKISKNAGGIGLAIHNVRCNGSYIKGTNGHSNGIVPMLRVFNNTARYVDQCITPDTIIYTKDGIKEIKKIKINDMIITKDGSFQKVTKIMHYNKNEKLYNLSLCNSIYDIKVTEFHPFLCIPNQKKGLNYNVIKNRLNKNLIKPEWVEMKDLNTNDLIGFPIPKYEEDIIEYSLDDCFMYGILIGDGYICKNSKLIGVCLNNTTKMQLVNFIKQYLSNKLIHYTESFNDKIIKLSWTSTNEFPYTRDMLYDDQDEKIIMGNMLHLPKDKIINIIKGVLLTDGCYLKEISLELTSKQVIESIRYMLLRCGILTSGYVRDRIGQTHEIRKNEYITNRKKTYVLRIPKKKIISDIYNIEEGKFFKFFEHNQILYSRIKNISSFNYDGLVYDLEIANNHNYLTHSGLIHNGGGKRKGSFAMYLEPWHGDIFSFLNLRKNHGNEEDRCRDLFLGLWVPDLFMERVFNDGIWSLMCPNQCKGLHLVYGEEFEKLYTSYEQKGKYLKQIKARKLWNAILDSQMETGTPYMLYKDACNRKSNQQNLGTIQSSNLCVHPETMILTENGYYKIKDLENKPIKVWNGEEFSETIVKKTGSNQKIITVKFDNNNEIKCTPYHKFYIETSKRPSEKSKIKKKEAKELKEGDKIIRYNFPIIKDFKKEMKYPYIHGLFCADGTYSKKIGDKQCSYKKYNNTEFCKRHKNYKKLYNNDNCSAMSGISKPLLYLYDKKKELFKYIDNYNYYNEYNNRIILELPHDLKEKYFVPINYSINTKIKWLEGLFDGDGCILNYNGLKNIQLANIHKEFLIKISYLLNTLGLYTNIALMRKKCKKNMPNGKNGYKEYMCKEIYRITIDSSCLIKLKELGFNPKRLDISNLRTPHHKTNKFIRIKKIEDNNEYSDTYCFNEPKKHMGIFNGILTGNCTEIIEYTSKDEAAVCNLASIGLPKFIKKSKNFEKLENVILYGKTNCMYCKLAKTFLENNNIEYTYVSLDDKTLLENFFKNNNIIDQNKTLPKIFNNNENMGGYTDLMSFLKPYFDFELLGKVTKLITRNLDTIIDINFYPIPQTKNSNLKHRPIGIGVQGLADVFYLLKLPFDSDEAKFLNKQIFATIYYHALVASNQLAIEKGCYSSFEGSPASKGLLQFNLWNQKPLNMYDWDELKQNIIENGLRNSLLLAPMPTASTSQILGNNECIEPYTTNVYIRRTLAGEFICMNKHLLKDLMDLGIWNKNLKNQIIQNNGSLKDISSIPDYIKNLYKTVWEIKQKNIIDMAADRGIYIDQSQSLNIHMSNASHSKLTSMHFYGWKKGLKTGMYYLRTQSAADSIKFTIDKEELENIKNEEEKQKKILEQAKSFCNIKQEDECTMCSA